MEYIYICPKCGATYGCEGRIDKVCVDCGEHTANTGFTNSEWFGKTREERREYIQRLILGNTSVCKYCGEKIGQEMDSCPHCGHAILADDSPKVQTKASQSAFSGWGWAAVISFLCSAFTLYKGIDKMVNYYYSEYSWGKTVNAYVGGDAYNYIINGNYATGFFVLTAMFALMGIGFIIVSYMSKITKQMAADTPRENQ